MLGVEMMVLQVLDPTTITELPAVVRGPVAFLLVSLFGTAFFWRFAGIVDRSITASIDRPLSSMVYGVGGIATLLFFGLYVTSQFAQLSVEGQSMGRIGIWLGVLALAATAGLGFTVVGSAVVELGSVGPRWWGVLLGAGIAGIAAMLSPLLAGLIWIVTVSMGIGGPVRSWIHAAEDVESVA